MLEMLSAADAVSALGSSTGRISTNFDILTPASSWNFFFSRNVLRDDMLRYRTHDALRTKSTLLMSSNRLFLIYQNYMQWSDYMSRQASSGIIERAEASVSLQSGLRAADANGTYQDISILNTVFFINN